MAETSAIDQYLQCPSAEQRIKILQEMRDNESWLPLSLCSDLLKLRLSSSEHIAILRASNAKQRLVFEDYITSQLNQWDQNVAGAALWEWALRTDCIMWHRTLPLASATHSGQRIRYTLADLAWYGGGYSLIKHLVETEGLEDMSPAYHSLLCFRALQFGVHSQRLIDLARSHYLLPHGPSHLLDKAMPYYLAYLLRFDRTWVKKSAVDQGLGGIWTQFAQHCVDENLIAINLKALTDLSLGKLKGDAQQLIRQHWPRLWDRHQLESPQLLYILRLIAEGQVPLLTEHNWEFFAGVPHETWQETLRLAASEAKVFSIALNIVGSFLPFSAQTEMTSLLRQSLQAAKDPSVLIASLLPRYSALLNADSKNSVFASIFTERRSMIQTFETSGPAEIVGLDLWEKEFVPSEASRQNFFSLAYYGKKRADKTAAKSADYWTILSQAWLKPSVDKLEALSLGARQSPHLLQICFIDTLARFKGIDQAALKLLDFIRTKEEPVLRSVIFALQGIATPRAAQELVAFLTRPNVGPHLQLEITQILKDLDVSGLQSELRSALNDLDFKNTPASLEIRDAISSLLLIDDAARAQKPQAQGDAPNTLDLDHLLEQKINRYNQLSSEVKRALRTAQFFHIQVERTGKDMDTIDLSPAIDMQYKALELCFREKFEQACSEVIQIGSLQRKLDVIGYARPIPQAMDDFENFIERLPIIHSIPFFSRFKLRKMLRAICQYRPGKRFTLDGLKAFAIFFICFSRKECRHGLAEMFPIPNMTSEQIFSFCKDLHVFQDFRNRAAHEGFHPDASNNLDSIWLSTGKIIDGMFQIADGLEKPAKQFRKSS